MSHIKKMIFTFYRCRAVLITQCVFSQYRIYKIKRRITRNNRIVDAVDCGLYAVAIDIQAV